MSTALEPRLVVVVRCIHSFDANCVHKRLQDGAEWHNGTVAAISRDLFHVGGHDGNKRTAVLFSKHEAMLKTSRLSSWRGHAVRGYDDRPQSVACWLLSFLWRHNEQEHGGDDNRSGDDDDGIDLEAGTATG